MEKSSLNSLRHCEPLVYRKHINVSFPSGASLNRSLKVTSSNWFKDQASQNSRNEADENGIAYSEACNQVSRGESDIHSNLFRKRN